MIKKIRLVNFRKFKELEMPFNKDINILIGDNESGKSSILKAIDLVLSGSRSKIESIGLDNLINQESVNAFLTGSKTYDTLPELRVELYLEDQEDETFKGRNNLDNVNTDGVMLICKPDDSMSSEIKRIISEDNIVFPFEFYSVTFKTFADQGYNSYFSGFSHLLIDNSQISNEYATKNYVKSLFEKQVDLVQKNELKSKYRQQKEVYKEEDLAELNAGIENYEFRIKTGVKANLETDLTIAEGGINIENKGKGRQCFIRTDFALQKTDRDIDVMLLEEPENHLSHTMMKKLIRRIQTSNTPDTDTQMFIATHNDLIASRLMLNNAIFLYDREEIKFTSLSEISEGTSKFFQKAPESSLLQFILSPKIILVEGHSEYILMESFYEKVNGSKPYDDGVHIISVGGIKFKRYLEISNFLGSKTCVITDNDKKNAAKMAENYDGFLNGDTFLTFDPDVDRYTFEVCLYNDNVDVCEGLFAAGRKTLTVLEYMLANKAEASFQILINKIDEITIPNYIVTALQWIKG